MLRIRYTLVELTRWFYVNVRIAAAAATAGDDATELELSNCGKSSAILLELNSPGRLKLGCEYHTNTGWKW